jgi:hypothetical protein
MMQKSTTFTTILRVKKCHFHYDMQKISFCILELKTFEKVHKRFRRNEIPMYIICRK